MIGVNLAATLRRRRQGGGAAFDMAAFMAANSGRFWVEPGLIAPFVAGGLGVQTTATQAAELLPDLSGGARFASGAWTGLEADIATAAFSTDAGWTYDHATRTGTATAAGVGFELYLDGLSISASAVYVADVDITVTSGSLRGRIYASGTFGQTNNITASGNYKLLIAEGSAGSGSAFTNAVVFAPTAAFTGTVKINSVSRLPGTPARQFSASFQPTFQVTPSSIRFDGTDDRKDIPGLVPTAAGSLSVRFNGDTPSRILIGSRAASDGRCFLSLSSDGAGSGGIGADTFTLIKGTDDLRGAWHTLTLTWDGSDVALYQDGAEVYSGAQNGAVNTTVPMMLGCLNSNGTASSFWKERIGAAAVNGVAITAADAANIHNHWSSIA